MAKPLKEHIDGGFIRALSRSLAAVCNGELASGAHAPSSATTAGSPHRHDHPDHPEAQDCCQAAGTSGVSRGRAPSSEGFDAEAFCAFVLDNPWQERELLDRVHHVAAGFERFLPGPVPRRLDALLAVHGQHTGMGHFVFPAYVERHGLDYWEESMAALEEFTVLSTAEFAVRPFIRADQPRMMDQMRRWATSDDEHLRRLASEGCRPRLPWASPLRRFIADPSEILPVLAMLRHDPSEYVRRSVANNFNDISRDHPGLVLDICEDWHGTSAQTDRLIKHALRTLLKRGHTRALCLHGFEDPAGVEVTGLTMRPARIRIGQRGAFSFSLRVPSGPARRLRLEYVVHFLKKNGSLSPKVFQLREAEFSSGRHGFEKEHAFADLTTRRHHRGEHLLAVHVNGRELARTTFRLV